MTAEFESGTESSIGALPLQLTAIDTAPDKTAADPVGAVAAAASSGGAAGSLPAAMASPQRVDAAPVAPPAGPPTASAPGTGAVTLAWQGPAQVKVGEQFSAVLRVTSQQALRGLPLMVSYDPQLLQVVSAQEGDFFKQAGGKSTFNHRVDAAQGKVFITGLRQNPAGGEAGINGAGSAAILTFKTLKAAPAARLQLVSANPEPPTASPMTMPIEHVVRITP